MWHVSINWEVALKTDHFAPVETINEGMEMEGFHQFQSNIAFDIKTSHLICMQWRWYGSKSICFPQ